MDKNSILLIIGIFVLNIGIILWLFKILKTTFVESKQASMRKELMVVNENIHSEVMAQREEYQMFITKLQTYLATGKRNELKEHVYSFAYHTQGIRPMSYSLDQIDCINHSGLKNLFLQKYFIMQEKGIQLEVSIDQKANITRFTSFMYTELIGILLDNAIEASAKSVDPRIRIQIQDIEEGVELLVVNTYKVKPNLNKWMNVNYTTKGRRRGGLGLFIIGNVLANDPNIQVHTFVDDHYVSQQFICLEINMVGRRKK